MNEKPTTFQIVITFKDENADGVNVGIAADPPWNGPASGVTEKDMTPAQRMQMQWFSAITEMYSSAAAEDDEE